MPTSYQDPTKKIKVRQPLLRRFRSYYRAPRKSGLENLNHSQMYTDLIRVSKELENISINIINTVKVILDKEKDDNFSTLENDGSRYFDLESDIIGQVQFFCDWKNTGSYTEINSSPTMDSISSRIYRLQKKINRLENTSNA